MLDDLLRFYADGGFFMHVVLLFGLAAVMAVVLQFTCLRRPLNPLPITTSLLLTTVGAGLLGSVAGWSEAMQAMATTPLDMRASLAFAVGAIVFYPFAFALTFVVVLTPPAAVAAALRAASPRRWPTTA